MNTKQKKYTAFMESVCKEFNCPEMFPALNAGFKAFCEAYDIDRFTGQGEETFEPTEFDDTTTLQALARGLKRVFPSLIKVSLTDENSDFPYLRIEMDDGPIYGADANHFLGTIKLKDNSTISVSAPLRCDDSEGVNVIHHYGDNATETTISLDDPNILDKLYTIFVPYAEEARSHLERKNLNLHVQKLYDENKPDTPDVPTLESIGIYNTMRLTTDEMLLLQEMRQYYQELCRDGWMSDFLHGGGNPLSAADNLALLDALVEMYGSVEDLPEGFLALYHKLGGKKI